MRRFSRQVWVTAAFRDEKSGPLTAEGTKERRDCPNTQTDVTTC